MTTPKQDLTAEQIENFRSYCHAYLEKIGPTHGLVDCVCDLARKGIEAEAHFNKTLVTHGMRQAAKIIDRFTSAFKYSDPDKSAEFRRAAKNIRHEADIAELDPTPQKPEPSGGRGDIFIEGYFTDPINAGVRPSIKEPSPAPGDKDVTTITIPFDEWERLTRLAAQAVPSPTPGDKDVEREDEKTGLAMYEHARSFNDNRDMILDEPSPSGSVEGLVERLRDWRDGLNYALPEGLRDDLDGAAEALERMEQERDEWKWKADERSKLVVKSISDLDRLSLEVGRLKAAAQWAIPLAEIALENHRTGRIKAGHSDIRGKHADGRLVIGLWQDEIDEWDKARNALAGGE